MGKPDDFDIIDEQEEARDSGQLLAWLAGILILVLFGCAVGVAFMRLNDRWQDQPAVAPIATQTSQSTLVAQADGTPAPDQPTATVGTPAAAQSPTATTTPTPTSSPTPDCVVAVDSAFASLQPEAALGCALGPASIVWAAYESFERGAMLWRSDTDAAYAFFDTGAWQQIDERWDGQPAPSRGQPPAGLVVPERGFGYVWAIRDDLFQALGWARDTEKGFCARVQEFSDGWILADDPAPSCTAENLYNQATSDNWEPLLLAAHEDQQWIDGRAGPMTGSVATPAAAPGPGNPAGSMAARPVDQGIAPAPLAAGSISLDGNFSDWPAAWQSVPHVVYDADAFAGAPDLSARFQLLHSNEGLLVGVRVQDDLYRPGPGGTDQWQGDGLELQFDRDLLDDFTTGQANADDYQIGVAFNDTLTGLRGYLWLPFAEERSLEIPGAVNALGGPDRYSGYNAEFLIPWSWFGLSSNEIRPGQTFGFNLAVNDNDGAAPAQQTVLSFSPARTTHDNPTQWATLVLEP